MRKDQYYTDYSNVFAYKILTKFCFIFCVSSVCIFLYLFFYKNITNTLNNKVNFDQPIYETPEIRIPKIPSMLNNQDINNQQKQALVPMIENTNSTSETQGFLDADLSAKDAQKIFLAYELGDNSLASRLIVDFISMYPVSTYKHKVRLIGAKIMNEKGDYDGALEYIRQILSEQSLSNEDYSDAVLLLGAISRDRKQYDSYIQTFLEQAFFKSQEPNKSKLAFYLGYLLLNKEDYTSSIKYFNQVIGEDGVLGKADLYKAQHMRPERINELENFINSYPSSKNFEYVKKSFIEDIFVHGNDLVTRGYLDSAQKVYQKLLRYSNNDSVGDEARLKIADIYYKKQEYSKTISLLKEILLNDNKQKDPDALFVLGKLTFELNKPEESLTYFRRLIEDYPKNPYISKAREWQELISSSLRN